MEKNDPSKVFVDPDRVVVVAAIAFDRHGRVLATRRNPGGEFGGRWEFPGGKVEKHETLTEALAREVREELGARIVAPEPYDRVEFAYPSKTVEIHFFTCRLDEVPEPLVSSAHDRCEWVSPEALVNYDFLEADVAVVRRLGAIPARS